MTEKLNGAGNGVTKEAVVNASTPAETGVVDEVAMLIERGEARPISLDSIEKGLTALWQAASKGRGEDSSNQAVQRACVFNLVVCVDGDEQLAQVTETVAQITWSYPCRAIVLVRKPEAEKSETTASISAHCQLPTSSGNRVCCEQITIVGTGQAADGLWSMVLPLLVPDLPVVLWWPGDPCFHEQLFDRLLETADRVIVDSRAFVQPTTTFRHLAVLSSQVNRVLFSDLSWVRLTPWRTILAQMFDSPDYLPYLAHLDKVEIQYEAPDDHEQSNFSEALLLVGWLAHQLGWQPAFGLQNRGKDALLILNQGGVPLTVNLYGHNDRGDELGGVTQVKFTATRYNDDGSPARSAVFTATLGDDYSHAIATIEEQGAAPVTRNILFSKVNRIELLVEHLAQVRHDQVFEASLDLAGQLSGPR